MGGRYASRGVQGPPRPIPRNGEERLGSVNHFLDVEIFADDAPRIEYPETGDAFADGFHRYVTDGIPEWAGTYVVTYSDADPYFGEPDFPFNSPRGSCISVRVTFPGLAMGYVSLVPRLRPVYLPSHVVEMISGPGPQDDNVADALRNPHVRDILKTFTREEMISYLLGVGAWENLADADSETLAGRFIWCVAGDISEQSRTAADAESGDAD